MIQRRREEGLSPTCMRESAREMALLDFNWTGRKPLPSALGALVARACQKCPSGPLVRDCFLLIKRKSK